MMQRITAKDIGLKIINYAGFDSKAVLLAVSWYPLTRVLTNEYFTNDSGNMADYFRNAYVVALWRVKKNITKDGLE